MPACAALAGSDVRCATAFIARLPRWQAVERPTVLPKKPCITEGCITPDRRVSCFDMNTESLVTEADIWSRTIRPGIGDLSPEAAREWLRLRISDVDAERVRELSQKANAGQLNAAEERELENYLNVGRTLEFLKAKARLSLRGNAPR
jgi:hypothetical protein